MTSKLKQKCIHSQPSQTKLSARLKLNQTQSRSNQQSKSIKKSTSIKYLKQISPKRQKSSSKNIGNKILKMLQTYQQNLNTNSSQQNIDHNHQFNQSHLSRALKTLDFDKKRNCQTSRSPYKKVVYEQKISIKQNLLEKFQSNQNKIILMRQNLQKIFDTFKQRQKQINQMKSQLKNKDKDKIKNENNFLKKQISRVQQMIKQALLERQKLKHGPFSQLTKRTRK